ncbi:MAG: TIGR01440 family protein [Clostridiales bacterium]|nr:TIGR01440 family protein [Clostridiales bacterium]
MDTSELTRQAAEAVDTLLASAEYREGDIFVIGCSTSEIVGKRIGSASNEEAAKAVMDAILPKVTAAGLYLAVQGCEHINRALCTSRACMERHGLQEVWVRPWLHAGGAFATEAYVRIPDRVMVENLNAKAALGIDIGGTLIGMHLHPVVVPVHTAQRSIGEATLVLAKTRPKYVGGPRAQYNQDEPAHK